MPYQNPNNKKGEFMSLLQDILSQIQTIGGYGSGPFQNVQSYQDLTSLDPADIKYAMSQYADVGTDDLTEAMFLPITSGMLTAGRAKSQSPFIESKGTGFLHDLTKTMGGEEARKSYGGFAGTGASSKFKRQARDVYGAEMGDVLTTAGTTQQEGLQSIWDMINSWRESSLKIAGDIE